MSWDEMDRRPIFGLKKRLDFWIEIILFFHVSGQCATTATPTSSLSVTTVPKPNPALPFLCEWKGCMKAFKTAKEVEKHAISTHCPLGSDDIPCLWNRCDSMKRKRFSLMTHLQDRHCHPQVCSKQTADVIIICTPPK